MVNNLLAGLVSYYKLDENAANTTVEDIHGTNEATASVNTDQLSIAGKINTAFEFNGTSEFVSCGTDTSLELGSAGAISCWVWIQDKTPPVAAGFVSKDGAGYNDDMALGINMAGLGTSEIIFCFNRTPQNDIPFLTAGIINELQWYHVVATWDTNGMELFLNGTSVDSNATICEMVASGSPLQIGRNQTSYYLQGIIDEVGVWNRRLSPAAVTALWNSGNGLAYTSFDLGVQLNIADAWKALNSIQINIGDVWKNVEAVQINIGDAWKDVF